jgi:hypothetical protein
VGFTLILPASLDRLDAAIASGDLGRNPPTAANYQVAGTVRMRSTVDDLAPLLAHRLVTQLARELVPLPRIVAVLEAGRCWPVRGSIRGQERRAALLVRVSSVDSAATTRLAWSFNAACIGTGF